VTGRTCSACAHPARAEIDAALVAGTSFRNVSKQYGMSAAGAFRHRSEHLPARLALAPSAEDLAEADGLLAQLAECRATARRIGELAEAAEDYRAALAGVRELVRIVELQAKLAGELDERPQINLLVAPEWLLVRSTLLEVLQAYPEARTAVAARLVALETA
jgi:hypothetical protein